MSKLSREIVAQTQKRVRVLGKKSKAIVEAHLNRTRRTVTAKKGKKGPAYVRLGYVLTDTELSDLIDSQIVDQILKVVNDDTIDPTEKHTYAKAVFDALDKAEDAFEKTFEKNLKRIKVPK